MRPLEDEVPSQVGETHEVGESVLDHGQPWRSGSDEELADLSDELFKRGHRTLWIGENRPSLETIFMKVTKGQVQ